MLTGAVLLSKWKAGGSKNLEFIDSPSYYTHYTLSSDKKEIYLLICTILLFCRKSRSLLAKLFNPARIIRKSGKINIFLMKLPNKNLSYMRGLGNTLLSIHWRWILLTLFVVNFACFIVFGIFWYLTALNSGDFEANHTDVCAVNTKSMTGKNESEIEIVIHSFFL